MTSTEITRIAERSKLLADRCRASAKAAKAAEKASKKAVVQINHVDDFQEALRLLDELTDLQNGPPLEQHRKEWEETMEEIYQFLQKHGR